MSKTVLEILVKYHNVQKELNEFCELWDEAQKVFRTECKLADMMGIFDNAWLPIYHWSNYQPDNHHHIMIGDIGTTLNAFDDLQSAQINRREFKEKMQPACDSILKFIHELYKEAESLQLSLEEKYQEYVQSLSNTTVASIMDLLEFQDTIMNFFQF